MFKRKMGRSRKASKIKDGMRKYIKIIFILILITTTTTKAKITIPNEVMSDFYFHWLVQYDPNDFSPWLHPYEDDVIHPKIFILWDLDTDGIVNFQDFNILINIDIPTVLNKLDESFSKPIYGKTLEHLVHGAASDDLQNLKMIELLLMELGEIQRLRQLQYVILAKTVLLEEQIKILEGS